MKKDKSLAAFLLALVLTMAAGTASAGKPAEGERGTTEANPFMIGDQFFGFFTGAINRVLESLKNYCESPQNDLPAHAESCQQSLQPEFLRIKTRLEDVPEVNRGTAAAQALTALRDHMEDLKTDFRNSQTSFTGAACQRDVTRTRGCIRSLCTQLRIETAFFQNIYTLDPQLPTLHREVVDSCRQWDAVILQKARSPGRPGDRPLENTLGCPGSAHCRRPSTR